MLNCKGCSESETSPNYHYATTKESRKFKSSKPIRSSFLSKINPLFHHATGSYNYWKWCHCKCKAQKHNLYKNLYQSIFAIRMIPRVSEQRTTVTINQEYFLLSLNSEYLEPLRKFFRLQKRVIKILAR